MWSSLVLWLMACRMNTFRSLSFKGTMMAGDELWMTAARLMCS
jgi:hypothetical protein